MDTRRHDRSDSWGTGRLQLVKSLFGDLLYTTVC